MIVPICEAKKQRDTKWIIVCPDCQNERIVSYAQKWNVERERNSKACKACNLRLGRTEVNTLGLEKGRNIIVKRGGKKRPSSSVRLQLEHVFFPEKMLTSEIKEKQKAAKLGKFNELANAWAGGKTSQRTLEMSRPTYKIFRSSVFERDKYTCQICSVRGGQLEMDHIKEWCNYPKLRYEMSNCRTLCKPCHKQTDNYLNKAKRKGNL